MGTLWHDLRFSWRTLARQPAFFLTAVLTLALGIGANSAMFSVFNAVMLRPLPYRDADRLAILWEKRPDGQRNSVSGANFQEWRKQARSFERLSALAVSSYNITGAGDPVQVFGARVTADLFSCLGVEPVLGRNFASNEDSAGAAPVAILSYRLWQKQFGGDIHAVGRKIALNGISYTIAGVLPSTFEFISREFEVWMPLVLDARSSAAYNLVVVGRLAPGSTLERADQEMRVIAHRLAVQYPQTNTGWGVMISSIRESWLGDLRPAFMALLAAVAFVLLIACANVANLLLARSTARSKEIAIRGAIGAGRSQLLRQLLTESVLLGLCGGAAGLAIAWGGVRLIAASRVGNIARIDQAGVDATVLIFTLVISLLTAILFGLLPARQLLKRDLNATLRESGRSSMRGASGSSGHVLVICEIALSLILLIGAGLMIRSLTRLQNFDRGFLPDNLLTFRISMPTSRYRTEAQVLPFYRGLLARLQAVPGVEAVAATPNPPLDDLHLIGMYFTVEGAAPVPGSQRPTAGTNLINPGYFKALGIPIAQGRAFDDRDREGAPPVAIISASLAHRYFGSANPVGKHITVDSPGKKTANSTREIVGVSGDIRYTTKNPADSAEIYLPFFQSAWPRLYFMVRARVDPESLIPGVRAVVKELDPEQSVSDAKTMADRIALISGKSRWNSILAAIFAALALLLAAVGIYGVISYTTAQRTQEIGVRMALGAQSSAITGSIVRQALVLAGIGVAIGFAGYLALAKLLRSLLYSTSATDFGTLAGAACVLVAIAVAASYLPARRAARIDPIQALRAE